MSAIAMWLRAHPAPRWLLAALLVIAGLGLAAASLSGSASPAAPPASPAPASVPLPAGGSPTLPSTTTSVPTATASPDAESMAQAIGVARAFLAAYLSQRSDEAPDAMRQRLRPFDTDTFDAGLAQGGGAGQSDQATASVQRLDATGLAPDGRLVLVALLEQGGSTRYLELFMAPTAAGWRVDEVAA